MQMWLESSSIVPMTQWDPAHITSIQATASVTPTVNDQAFVTATTPRSRIYGMRLSIVTNRRASLQFPSSDHLLASFWSGYRSGQAAKAYNLMERLWHIMELVFSLAVSVRSGLLAVTRIENDL